MMKSPKITVITSVFNGVEYLEQSIQSILNQSYENIEYIIVDGGSTDGSVEILEKYEHEIDVIISEPDRGIYDAWNKGLKVSSGEWISFVGCDDFLETDAIEKYVGRINQANEEVDYLSSKVKLINASGELIRVWGSPWIWNTFKWNMKTAHVGSLHNKLFFQKYGLYDIGYRVTGDYELLLRAGKNLKYLFLDEITANMRMSGVSNSSMRAFKEAFRAKRVTGKRNAFLCLMDFLFIYAVTRVHKLRSIIKN